MRRHHDFCHLPPFFNFTGFNNVAITNPNIINILELMEVFTTSIEMSIYISEGKSPKFSDSWFANPFCLSMNVSDLNPTKPPSEISISLRMSLRVSSSSEISISLSVSLSFKHRRTWTIQLGGGRCPVCPKKLLTCGGRRPKNCPKIVSLLHEFLAFCPNNLKLGGCHPPAPLANTPMHLRPF